MVGRQAVDDLRVRFGCVGIPPVSNVLAQRVLKSRGVGVEVMSLSLDRGLSGINVGG